MSDTAPRRAFVLNLKVQANTRRDLADALRTFAMDLERELLSGFGVSASPSSGWSYTLDVDETITKEAYFAAVNEYLRRAR